VRVGREQFGERTLESGSSRIAMEQNRNSHQKSVKELNRNIGIILSEPNLKKKKTVVDQQIVVKEKKKKHLRKQKTENLQENELKISLKSSNSLLLDHQSLTQQIPLQDQDLEVENFFRYLQSLQRENKPPSPVFQPSQVSHPYPLVPFRDYQQIKVKGKQKEHQVRPLSLIQEDLEYQDPVVYNPEVPEEIQIIQETQEPWHQ